MPCRERPSERKQQHRARGHFNRLSISLVSGHRHAAFRAFLDGARDVPQPRACQMQLAKGVGAVFPDTLLTGRKNDRAGPEPYFASLPGPLIRAASALPSTRPALLNTWLSSPLAAFSFVPRRRRASIKVSDSGFNQRLETWSTPRFGPEHGRLECHQRPLAGSFSEREKGQTGREHKVTQPFLPTFCAQWLRIPYSRPSFLFFTVLSFSPARSQSIDVQPGP